MPLAEEQVRTIQLYLSLGLSTGQIASFLHCVLKNKEAFCKEVLPIYRQKLAEIDDQIRLLQNIKSNLENRIRSILDEQKTMNRRKDKMSMQSVDETTFRESIREQGVTLVDFVAPWCPPCKTLLPILDELEHEYGDQLSILKVNCDESPAVAAEYGFMSMPTVIVFHNGEPVEKLVGLRPTGAYQAVLARYI